MTDYFQLNNNFQKTEHIPSTCIIEGKIKDPYLSIAIPTYKRADLLKETLDSALCQKDIVPYEIIVVDNNPERDDDTEKLLKSIEDPRISYYKNNENLQLTGNWNRLYTLAKGEWVTMIHDDDLLCQNFMEDITPFLKKDYDIISGTFSPFTKSPLLNTSKISTTAETVPFQRLWNSSGLIIAGLTIRKSSIMRIGGFNPKYQNLDCVLITQISYYGKALKISKPLTAYRIACNDSLNSKVYENCIIGEFERQQFILRKSLPKWLAELLQINTTLTLVEAWNKQFKVNFPPPIYSNVSRFRRLISRNIGIIYSVINKIIYPSKKVYQDA